MTKVETLKRPELWEGVEQVRAQGRGGGAKHKTLTEGSEAGLGS